MIGDLVSDLSSAMAKQLSFICSTATFVVIYAMFREHFPQHLQDDIEKYGRKLVHFAYPYTQITFDEFTGEHMRRSEAFTAIRNYLSDKSTTFAKRLKADAVKDGKSLVLSMDYNEEIADEYEGVKVWWTSSRTTPRSMQFSVFPGADEKRHYKLTFRNKDRDRVTRSYLCHVLEVGKAIGTDNRLRKLFCNNPSKHWDRYSQNKWSHVVFEHPATFKNLAMDAKKKEEIKNDLIKFRDGRDYYRKMGKAWKRGYLLYGPPGTGKSTMIAAMANLLEYDVYDLELTTVKDNTELRRLLIDTSSKSIIVIEDIDCSIDLTGQRENKKKEKAKKEKDDEKLGPITKMVKEEETTDSKLTLSGVLNFTDGLWSSCGGERIIVFTTNYLEKLDPALIRKGRMDKEIEMSYCCFDAFKVLANNYLQTDSHRLFKEIHTLLRKTKMTPADVAEDLMPKSDGENEETCLNRLIKALKAQQKKDAEEASRPKGKRKRSNNLVQNRKKRAI
ncbi:hypothetical protein DITRI_Ditri16bG0121600 [Diplodiscus trichospermus]